MPTFTTTNGLPFTVSDEDTDLATQYKWRGHPDWKSGRYYIVYKRRCDDGKYRDLYISRLILERQGFDLTGFLAEHKNGDTQDNTRENLRPATHAQNQANARKRRMVGRRTALSSVYIGVQWVQKLNKWRADISYKGRRIYIGLFLEEEQAARAFDAKARELHGEYARLNFP